MSSIYVYGIIESAREASLGIPGVDGSTPARIVSADGLGCVVSDYDDDALSTLPKEDLIRCLFAHQRVIEQVMCSHTVLPVRFGTVLTGPQEAYSLLSQRREELLKALSTIRDKVEMEVAATWDTSGVLREISTEEELVRARGAILKKGHPSLEDRIRFGQLVKARIDKRREAYRQRTVSHLQPLAIDLVSSVLLSDEMVMNLAFLIDQSQQAQFDAHIQRLDELFMNEIRFRVIGPLPLYRFSTVEIARLTLEQVGAALQVLGLKDVPSETEVKQAYRRLAAQAQRNLNSGDAPAHIGFANLRKASELLQAYLRSRSKTPQPTEAPVFITTIRRAEEELPHAPLNTLEGV